MPYKDKEKQRKYQREWYYKNQEYRKMMMRKYRYNNKLKVINILGGKCVYCGCDNPDALEVNHIKGNGKKDYKTRGGTMFYLDIIKGRRKTDDLELTCAICNIWHKLVILRGIPNKWTITYNK